MMKMCFDDEMMLRSILPNKQNVKCLSQFFYAFSDETRLKIVILLTINPLCVGDICKVLDINQTTVSHQLKILRSLGVVEFDRKGKTVVYYIKNKDVEDLLNIGVDCILISN